MSFLSRRRALVMLASAAGSAAFSTWAEAISYEWKTAAGGSYSQIANWSRTDGNMVTALPTVGDTVVFNQPYIFNVSFTGSVAADVLNFESGAVTFAGSGGQKLYVLTSGLAQANLTDGTLTLGISGGAITFNVTNLTLTTGATMLPKFNSDVTATNLKIGTADSTVASTMTLDGVGTTLSVSGPTVLGGAGATGVLNFTNQSSGTLSGTVTLGDDTSTGILQVHSSATLSAGNLAVGSIVGSTGSGSLVVDGSATLTLTGTSAFTLGASSGQTSTATVTAATMSTGTGLSTINATGALLVDNTSTFNLNGDMTLSGGSATFGLGSLHWASGKTVTIGAGGSMSLVDTFTTPANSTLHATGGTFTINAINPEDDTTLVLGSGSNADATGGGSIVVHALAVGSAGTSSMTVDGPGSFLDATGSPYSSIVGTAGGTGVLTVRNGATAGFDNALYVGSFGSAANGTVNINTGATVFAFDLLLGDTTTGSASRATVNVTGAGSALLLNGSLVAGNATSTSSITVSTGASLVQGNTTNTPIGVAIGSGSATLLRGSTLAISGGFVSLGELTADANVVTLTSGSLGFDGNLSVGATGMLGFSVNLGSQQAVALTGSTTIDVGASLTLSGGALSTGSLVNHGTFGFASGTLALTGTTGLSVDSSGPLGGTPNLASGKNLIVADVTTVTSPSALSVTGGSFTTDSLSNSGSITVNNYGSLNVNSAFSNTSTGRLFIGPDLTAAVIGASTNAGRITLQGGSTRLVGTDALTNTGLITGDGEIAKPILNNPGGELRAESGKSLLVSGPSVTNAGKINLTGGTLEFTDALTNDLTGTIVGRGTLIAGGGLTNNGQASFSGGLADVYGPVTNNLKILVTGGSSTTFYDPLVNNTGADIFTAVNSSVVFLSPVTGSGTFSGPGAKYFSDGSSTTGALESSGLTVVSEAASLTVPDFIEQSVTVNGSLATTPATQTPHASETQLLTIGPSGKVDLSNNSFVLDYSSGASAPEGLSITGENGGMALAAAPSSAAILIRQYLRSSQIVSSAAAGDRRHLLAIGYAEASELGVSSWANLSVDSTSIMTKLTYIGDANLDGRINGDDYALLDRGLAQQGATWTTGDFNYDGVVNSADYLLIDRVFALQGGSLSPAFLAGRESEFGQVYVDQLLASIPEPGMLAGMGMAMPFLLRNRRRVI